MAVNIENPTQIEQVGGVVQTADLSLPEQVAQSKRGITQQIHEIGAGIYNKFSSRLGEINAQKDIAEQQKLIAQGKEGVFNNVGTVASLINPAYTQAYNTSINNIAIPFYGSKLALGIQKLSQDIKVNDSISPDNKTAVLSKQINDTLPKELNDIPEEYRDKVSRLAYSHATQELSNMMSFAGQVQLERNKFSSLNSIDDINNIAKSVNNLTDANKYVGLGNDAITGALHNGYISAGQAEQMIKANRINVYSSMAVNAGISKIDEWNKANGSIIPKDEIDAIQSNIWTADYRKQKQMEVDQAHDGYSFSLNILRAQNGLPVQKPAGGYTYEENQHMQTANLHWQLKMANDRQARLQGIDFSQEVGKFYEKFKNATPEDLIAIQTNNKDALIGKYSKDDIDAFDNQQNNVKSKVISLIDTHHQNFKNVPYQASGLSDKTPFTLVDNSKPFSADNPLMQNTKFSESEAYSNFSPYVPSKDMAKALVGEQLPQLTQQYMSSPTGTTKLIKQTFSPAVSNEVMKMLSANPMLNSKGLAIVNTMPTNFQDAYNVAKTNKIPVPRDDKALRKELSSIWHPTPTYNAFVRMQPSAQLEVLDAANNIVFGSMKSATYSDFFDNAFDIYQSQLVRKGDKEIFGNITRDGLLKIKAKYGVPKDAVLSYVSPSQDVYGWAHPDGTLYNTSFIKGDILRAEFQNGK